MPEWLVDLLLKYVVPLLVDVLENEGIPELKKQFPALVPFLNKIEEILKPIG